MQLPAAQRLLSDDRGAVMVLGIFMCAAMVGALWYIAGIGDAIVYRERLQEAADAGALSNAVLHARGMNLLVFINLVMACVLAIRVALKVIQLTLIIAGVIFAGLAFIPGMQWMAGIAEACAQGASQVQNVINSTREPINNTLKGLHTAQKGIARAIPGASAYGSKEVVDKYKPFVVSGFSSADVDKLANGLPVVDGTTDRLCGKAGEAMVDLLDDLNPVALGDAMGPFKKLMAQIVAKGSGYFCELGGSNKPPDLSDITDNASKDRCGQEYEGKKKILAEKSQEWHVACDAAKVICIDEASDPLNSGVAKSTMTGLDALQKSTKPEDKATLARLMKLKDERDKADDAVKSFDQPKCVDEKKKELKKQLDTVPPAQKTSGQGMEPMKVDPKWANGTKDAQLLAYAKADDDFLVRSPKGVRIGAMKNRSAAATTIDVPVGAEYGYAQAEFFYDCEGAWGSDKCNAGGSPYNDDQEAMWHLRWRARLRRYSKPYDKVDLVMAQLIRVRMVALGLEAVRKSNLSSDTGNLQCRYELMKTLSIEYYELH